MTTFLIIAAIVQGGASIWAALQASHMYFASNQALQIATHRDEKVRFRTAAILALKGEGLTILSLLLAAACGFILGRLL